jgi:hypothetical protein
MTYRLAGAPAFTPFDGNLTAVASPTAANANAAKIAAVPGPNRPMLAQVDVNGVVEPLQASLAQSSPEIWTQNSAGPLMVGSFCTTTGTPSFPVPAATNYQTQARRVLLTSSAVANSACGIAPVSATGQRFWIGNASRLGGFYFACVFSCEDTLASANMFVGLSANGISTAPTSTFLNCIGVGIEGGETSLHLFTAGTVNNTGLAINVANFPTPQGAAPGTIYKLELYCSPASAAGVSWQLTNLGNGFTARGVVAPGTTLPASNVFLGPVAFRSNGGVAATATLAIVNGYCGGLT